MAELTMHWYPNYIIDPIHKMRSMKIIVKENASFDGNTDKFYQELDKKSNEIVEIVANSANVWKSGKKVSDIRTTDIDKNTKRITQADPIYAVCLPLPNELMDQQSHRWEMEAGLIGQLAGSAVDKMSIGGKVGVNKVLAEASMSFGFRKPMVDPGMFQNYGGSAPRSFNFGFDFIPNNADEALSIMNIILNLKKFSLPRTIIGGVSLLAPFIFEIEIGNENMRKLINMNDVVMTEIGVNYGADGNMQMFSNGMPKFIQLTLAFSERSLVTSEFYDAPEEAQG
jgi:hypothetical protein